MLRTPGVEWFAREIQVRSSKVSQPVLEQWYSFRRSLAYPIQEVEETVGEYGERLASIFLERGGYTILERSFRTKTGEIDIIAAWQSRVVVFVEVKTWSTEWANAGGPSDAVDDKKQEKITRTALIYMKRHKLLHNTPGRADVIEIGLDPTSRHPVFRHYINAFEAVGSYQMFS